MRGGSLAAVSVTSEPRSSRRAVSADVTAEVEYRLVRNGVVREVERGKVLKIDVCDAHPELLRAARNVGRPTKERCPICDDGRLVKVTFVFGAKLPPGGRCPGTAAELNGAVPPGRAGALLRGRGVPGVRLAPPDAQVPGRRRRARAEAAARKVAQ